MSVARENLGVATALFLSALVIWLTSREPTAPSHKALLLAPAHLKQFTLGYNEVVADVFWLRLIQDFDHCDARNEAEQELVDRGKASNHCRGVSLGWSYHMIEAVTEMAPKMRIAYFLGATVLGVVIDDAEGAKRIFDKGLIHIPHDWQLEYNAAYHYMAQIHDNARAGDLLAAAARDGGPGWLYSLAARLKTETGQAEFAEKILEDAIASDTEARWIPTLQERLKKVKEVLARTSTSGPTAKVGDESGKSSSSTPQVPMKGD